MELCLEGPSTIPGRKDILKQKKKDLLAQIDKLESAINYIDDKQQFYDDVLSGKREYISNLIKDK